jgi:hypothetical protein
MFAIFIICFLCFILPHRTLAKSQSFVVLGCRAWKSLPHDGKRLPTHGRFVSNLRGSYRSA